MALIDKKETLNKILSYHQQVLTVPASNGEAERIASRQSFK